MIPRHGICFSIFLISKRFANIYDICIWGKYFVPEQSWLPIGKEHECLRRSTGGNSRTIMEYLLNQNRYLISLKFIVEGKKKNSNIKITRDPS